MLKIDQLDQERMPALATVLVFVSLIAASGGQTPSPRDWYGLASAVQREQSNTPASKILDPAERPELVLQTGHAEKVDGLAYSPDGSLVASSGTDSTIKLWDAAQGRELRTLTGHVGGVKAVAFSPKGEQLASGGNDGKVRLWEVSTGREIQELPGNTSRVNVVTFSPDGRLVASGGADQTVRVWEVATGRKLRTYTEHKGWVLAIAFSPDSQLLASGSADATVRLWRVNSDEKARIFADHAVSVQALAFSPDGAVLASGATDGVIKLRRLVRNGRLPNLPRMTGTVLSMAFRPDGRGLIAASSDRNVREFDLETGRGSQILSPNDTLEKYETLVFSPDLLWQASNSGNPVVELRRLTPGGELHRLESSANAVLTTAFSRDQRWFASGHDDNTVKVWDITAGRQVRTFGTLGKVEALAFSPGGEWLASGSLGGAVKLWNLLTGRETTVSPGHAGSVNALVFSPDGKRLITGSSDKTIKIWDSSTGRELHTLSGHTADVNSLALSPDGLTLYSGSADKTIRLWDMAAPKEVGTITGNTAAIYAVALDPSGRRLASGGADNLVRLWDLSGDRQMRSLPLHANYVYALAFSPDGQTLASGGADRTVKLTDVATGQERRELKGHVGFVTSLSFAPGGQLLASGSKDGSTRLWAVASGVHLATLVSLRERSDWLVVTPDGLFDGSPTAWGKILWRFAQNTFKTFPVEVFFNEFFYPDLLSDVMAGNRPHAAVDISQRDRRQPSVKMIPMGIENGQSESRSVTVRIEISEAAPDRQQTLGSGARDVRLFRNGSLVKIWRGDVLEGRDSRTLEYTFPLVGGENRLTAYAFNRDNVKSADDTKTIVRKGGLERGKVLHILAIGVSKYENPMFNLEFAVDDARLFNEELQAQQARLSQFDAVEVQTLLDKDATKAGILAALHGLSESSAATSRGSGPGSLSDTGSRPRRPVQQPVQPEDAVIVFYAGHGWADQSLSERFYLVPYDIGNDLSQDAILKRSVTDVDLEEAFEGLDAANMLLVIDACDSGQALEAKEKRRGPMNSKGLAQLAYEKGMNVLTAAQSDQSAYETAKLGHGYLTWALINEGLKNMLADENPPDGEVLLREWLDFATSTVPRLQEEMSGRARRLTQQKKTQVNEFQRPRVFYRREPELYRFVIARKDAGPTPK